MATISLIYLEYLGLALTSVVILAEALQEPPGGSLMLSRVYIVLQVLCLGVGFAILYGEGTPTPVVVQDYQ